MKTKNAIKRAAKKMRSPEKEQSILEGALRVFGEKGFEETTIAAICKAANISDATLYEYFASKEEVLFSIPELYTRRELERMRAISHYLRGAKEKIRIIIQAYLEFYENNRCYTSVALLTLKGNRRFLQSPSYQVVREAAHTIVEAFDEGVAEGVFRDDIDAYLVRNLILGFIEHLTIQWLLVDRPQRISEYQNIIYDMVMRAIEKKSPAEDIQLRIKIEEEQLKRVLKR